jgi:hypothetical protein
VKGFFIDSVYDEYFNVNNYSSSITPEVAISITLAPFHPQWTYYDPNSINHMILIIVTTPMITMQIK